MQQTICTYLGYIFLNYCLLDRHPAPTPKPAPQPKLRLLHQFHLNLTSNPPFSTLRPYKNHLYLTLPFVSPLARLPHPANLTANAPLERYPPAAPSAACAALGAVQAFEIDAAEGSLWAVDAAQPNCPAKLVIVDLEREGRALQTYFFPAHVAQRAALAGLALEAARGGFAYVADGGALDPGLIVYSRSKNRAWKLRDSSFFGRAGARHVRSVALAAGGGAGGGGVLFYGAAAGRKLYAVDTGGIVDEARAKSGDWRRGVRVVGRREAWGEGLAADGRGSLYYGMGAGAVGKYRIGGDFGKVEVYRGGLEMGTPVGLAVEGAGGLLVMTYGVLKGAEGLGEEIYRVFKMDF